MSTRYWWDLPLVVYYDNTFDHCSTRELLRGAAAYRLYEGGFEYRDQLLDVVEVDFNDKDKLNWTVRTPLNDKPRIFLIKHAPEDWDRPEFSSYFLTEWKDESEPRAIYLALMPRPAPAVMEPNEFWASLELSHSHNQDRFASTTVLTRHGWMKMKVQYVAHWIDSIDMENLVTEEENGDAITEYRSEESAPVKESLKDDSETLAI
ncbi:hypothetical protein F4805DRAFT_453993 [Annulohypoxylon moriforme]|nr:hypothetical protein F4805DRAFT_453993 [Annulohypoxylon moriforme]